MSQRDNALRPADRERIMSAIRQRLWRVDPKLFDTVASDAPGGLADVERQLGRLVQIARDCTANTVEPYLAMVREEVCPSCPYVEVSGGCALRERHTCLINEQVR